MRCNKNKNPCEIDRSFPVSIQTLISFQCMVTSCVKVYNPGCFQHDSTHFMLFLKLKCHQILQTNIKHCTSRWLHNTSNCWTCILLWVTACYVGKYFFKRVKFLSTFFIIKIGIVEPHYNFYIEDEM